VFPAVASTMTPPLWSKPSFSARWIIPIAARSFTLPPGFRYSSLAKTSAQSVGTILRRCSIGVCPTSSVISSATRRDDLDRVGTLQGTTASGDLVIGSSGEVKIWPNGFEYQSLVFADE